MRHRLAMGLVLAISMAWLLYVITAAYRNAPEFLGLFEGLGNPLPPITRTFFLTYRWWWLLPALLTVLSVDLLRRPNPPVRYFAVVLAATLFFSFAMQAWMYEAFFQPLTKILEAIG